MADSATWRGAAIALIRSVHASVTVRAALINAVVHASAVLALASIAAVACSPM